MKPTVTIATSLLAMAMALTNHAANNYEPQRNDFSFVSHTCTSFDEGDLLLDSIITFVIDKNGPVYAITSETLPLDVNLWTGFGEIAEEDINFDGIPDLQICLGPTNAYGGFTYDGYVWDNVLHRFTQVENFDKIMDPYYDSSKRRITGTYRVDDDLYYSVYEWRDNKLVLIEESTDHISADE